MIKLKIKFMLICIKVLLAIYCEVASKDLPADLINEIAAWNSDLLLEREKL